MRSPFLPDSTLRARGRVWRLRDVTEHGDCVELHLLGGGPEGPPTVLVHPFDRVTLVPPCGRPRVVRVRTWCRALAARVAGLRAFDRLAAPVAARFDLLPFQLEPAIAMAIGGTPRVLLADAVGLGKTIQAGLAISELFARGLASRALVLAPASLRDQWQAELRSRFALDAVVVDAPALRARAAALPRTISPWTVSRIAIVSIDYAKRPEVLTELAQVPWDVVVIDEAHAVTQDSARRTAAHRLAVRASHVALLTATPHSGDDGAFAALTGLGARSPDEALVVFRRSKTNVGCTVARHSRVLSVRPGGAERGLMALLLAYLRALWDTARPLAQADARLVATLLLKRALSTPDALLRSVLRRRALLCAGHTPRVEQLPLSFDDESEAADEAPDVPLAAPGLPALSDEIAWLDQLAAAGEAAARESRKVTVLERFVRRTREPVIVFTEYRDTLVVLARRLARTRACVSLHGGLDQVERRAVLAAFSSGAASILLTTDAAGMGLNLHERCRLVVNLELPWSPVRLEQRVGRVDRIGQLRVVHAVHLVGRGSPEARVLTRLVARADRARTALDDAAEGPVIRGAPGESAVAQSLLGLTPGRLLRLDTEPEAGTRSASCLVRRVELAAEAVSQTRALAQLRLLHGAALRRTDHAAGVVMAMTPRAGRRLPLSPLSGPGAAVVAVFEHCITDASGSVVDEALLPFLIDGGAPERPRGGIRAFARRHAGEIEGALRRLARDEAARRLRQVALLAAAAREAMAGRNAAGHVVHGAGRAMPVQPGLFDRRFERAIEHAHAGTMAWVAARRAGSPDLVSLEPRLRWVLAQWPAGRREPGP
jgi:superfamily II DNA or RNA helicase